MIINNNIPALNTHRQLESNNNAAQQSMEKLSSGLRINRAGDDAAGLAISEKMRGQISGLQQASRNAQDGISMIQTAEGALNESHEILQRMRELSVQSANDTNTEEDRAELQKEVDQLSQELSRIGDTTEFNTQNLLDGSLEATFQIGANEGQSLSLSIEDMRGQNLDVVGDAVYVDDNGDEQVVSDHGLEAGTYTTAQETITIGDEEFEDEDVLLDSSNNIVAVEISGDYYGINDIESNGEEDPDLVIKEGASEIWEADLTDVDEITVGGIDISDRDAADSAITTIDSAIEQVSAQRSELGALQNRLEHTTNNLGTSAENLQAAESRIRDVDYACAA